MNTITLPFLNRQIAFLNRLKETGLQFDIQLSSGYGAGGRNVVTEFRPEIKSAKTYADIGAAFNAKLGEIPLSSFQNCALVERIIEHKCADNCELAKSAMGRVPDSPVKFYADKALGTLAGTQVYVITKDPMEIREGDRTYRLLTCGNTTYYGQLVLCVDERHPIYNYIDKNHVLVLVDSENSKEPMMFVANQLSLDVNYLIAAASVYPPALKDVLQQEGCFLNYRDARIGLMRAERAIPPRFQEQYKLLRGAVLKDFEENAQHVMINKLTRQEANHIDLNRIRITTTTATYETVSITADDLAAVVFQKLNPNEEWDIFTLINIYTDHIENYFNNRPLNEAGTGFAAAEEKKFTVNGIEITVSVATTNTRRSINGVLINRDELSKVMRRSACFADENHETNQKDFNNFVRDVGKMSLHVTDTLLQGLPVKVVYLPDDNQHGKDAGAKHPKLKFRKRDGKFYFYVDANTEKELKRFVSLIHRVEALNRKYHKPYYYGYGGQARTHEGGIDTNGKVKPNDFAKALLPILKEHIETLEDKDLETLVQFVEDERSEAEKKSLKLLEYAVKVTKAERIEFKGKWGYKIKGQMRNYFVEEDGWRTYDADTGQYYCVVQGRGARGVGQDGLVTRLFALQNDSMITKDVPTLVQR